MSLPDVPPIPCPDCDGNLVLSHLPESWGGNPNKPYVYLCENRADGCRGVMAAHPCGKPTGTPANAEVRVARRHCHDAFDRLWKHAWHLPCYAHAHEGEWKEVLRARKTITKSARSRAYDYVAHQLGMEPDDCHISKITDLDTLRRFYVAARGADAQIVRDWWKAQRNPQ